MFENVVPAASASQIAGGSDARLYAPNRDLAYAAPAMIHQALSLLPQAALDEPYAAMIRAEYFGVDGDPFADGSLFLHHMEGLARSLSEILMRIRRGDDTQLETIIADSGFCVYPAACRLFLLAKLGELQLGAMFMAVKDITPVDGEPPNVRRLESLVEEAQKLADFYKSRTGASEKTE